MTDRFVTAAELMARVLGADGYPFAVIEHPISSASDAAPRRAPGMGPRGNGFAVSRDDVQAGPVTQRRGHEPPVSRLLA